MISIIMGVYNTEKYLETAILSVLMQTYDNFELICIDDCSTDTSLEILEKFSASDSRIKIIKNETNKGLAYNRNLGIKISKGDYIIFLDSDDWLAFNTLEILHSVVKTNNLDILMFKFMTYWEDLNSFSIEPFYDMKFMDKFIGKAFNHYDLEPNSLFDIPGASCNKLYSKDFLVKNNFKFPEGLIFEDVAVFFDNMIKANRVSLVDEYLYNRRRRKNSITTSTGKKLLDSIEIGKELIKVFLDKGDEIYNHYKNGALNITFSFMRGKYNSIDDEYKEEFIKRTRELIRELDNDYDLINDIEENLNKNNLDFYNKLNYTRTYPYACNLKNFKIYFQNEIVISDLKFTDGFTNIFLNNNSTYTEHKETFLTYIFEKLKEKCIKCHDDFREEIFQQCKFLVNKLYSEYDLYEDIQKYVDSNLLDFFNQNVIMNN